MNNKLIRPGHGKEIQSSGPTATRVLEAIRKTPTFRNGDARFRNEAEAKTLMQVLLTCGEEAAVKRVREYYRTEDVTIVLGEQIGQVQGRKYVNAVNGVALERPIPLAFAGIEPAVEGLMW